MEEINTLESELRFFFHINLPTSKVFSKFNLTFLLRQCQSNFKENLTLNFLIPFQKQSKGQNFLNTNGIIFLFISRY